MWAIWAAYVVACAGLGAAQLAGFASGDAGQTLQTMFLALILCKMSIGDA
jgi:hypothetical protein